jgi:YHS domain-containing protein
MMKEITTVAIVAVFLGVSAVAQQTPDKRSPQGGQMTMGDMMKGCREHCQATTKSMEQMGKSMDEAKASTDPAKVRAALDQAQKPLADMKEHMGMCMNMMAMMEKMHGGGMANMMGGSDHMGMMSGEQMKMAMSTKELATVCNGKVTARNAPTATYEGRTYYFCSKADKEKFDKSPATFVKK